MDRKSIIILGVCFALLFLMRPLVDRLLPPTPVKPGATNLVTQAQGPAATGAVWTSNLPPPVLAPATAPRPLFFTNVAEETIILTNDDARYTFTSRGGGLKLVELVHYPETVSRQRKGEPLTNGVATLNTRAPAPVLAVLGDEFVQGDGIFTLTKTASGTGVRAEKTLANGLRLVKEFQPSTNYLVNATVWLQNTTSNELALPAQEWVVGTATPMGPDDDGQSLGLMWYNGASKEEITAAWFDNRTLGCFPGVPRPEYRAGLSNVVWIAPHNQFFTIAAMPGEVALQVVSRPVDLPRPADEITPNDKPTPPKGFQTALVYPSLILPAGHTLERKIIIFAGPKEYRTLRDIADRFRNNVDLIMGFGGFFGFFSKALLVGMNWLHETLKLSYGWAIIAITIIIKSLFWPLTAVSTRSMKRMAALQPQMKAIQDKYKDDPMKGQRKVMEFMKENKVSPLGGCLPMLLQMPVFIGFFYMIRSAIELRGASWLWVADLAKPDTLFNFNQFIPGLNFPFNLLPLLMGGTMLWQAHLTPPSPTMDPMQQKMMKYMPLMFLVFLYNFSAALALYWTVSNLLTILQTKLTKSNQPIPVVAPASALTPAPKKKK